MRQEARDLRSFLVEPVEEVSLEQRDVENMEDEVDDLEGGEDFTLRQTRPISAVSDSLEGQRLRPYRLQRYQSRGVTVALARSASGTLRLRPARKQPRSEMLRARVTEQLVPSAQEIVPVEPSLMSRRRRDIYVWLVLITLFLLVILGGIGLDSLIGSYH